MSAAPLPPGEDDRLRGLRALRFLDTPPEPEFEDLAAIAASLVDVPMALVTLVDESRQWFKARIGVALCETSREVSFCAHAILSEAPLVVPDAAADSRFSDNPLVVDEPGVRFYCGAPIIVDGHAIGTVCAVDRVPRRPSERQVSGLVALARQAAALIKARGEADHARQAEEMLRAAAEASFDTFIVLSPLRNEEGAVVDFRFEFLNGQAQAFFGTSSGNLVGKPLIGTFPTDNCRRFLGVFIKVLQTGEAYETEYVSQMPAMDGRWARVKIARAGDRIALTGQDVHESRMAEKALAAAKARLSATFDAVQVGIMVVSPEGKVLRANPEAERALSLEAGATRFVGSRLEFETLRLDGTAMPADERPVSGALMGRAVRGTMMRLRWPSGREMCIHANAVPLWNEGEEKPYAAVCSFLDVSAEFEQRRQLDERFAETAEMNILLEAQHYQLEAANERLAALATTDGLTGLRNHRTFQEELAEEIQRAKHSGAPLSIALLDVDRFKAFNDEHGHQAGDAVLRGVAKTLESSLRFGDLAARYGGEEFVVVMPDTDAPSACKASERIRKAIQAQEWEHGAVTASFGVATLDASMSQEALIETADQALYQSKRAGRNRVTLATPNVSLALS